MNKKINIDKKNAYWYSTGLVLYSITSLLFMIITTRINGLNEAGIFTFGFSFATMIQVIANYYGRTFQVTENRKDVKDSDFLKFKIITCFIMIIFGVIFCIIRGYELYKVIIIILLVLYRALDAYSESIYAVFQRNNNLYKCGISMTIKSFACTITYFIADYLTNNMLFSIIILLATDLIIFLSYDCRLLNKYKIHFNKLSSKIFKYLLFGGFIIFVMSFLAQYLSMIQKYVIDFMLTNEDQTIFGIIIMPATFINMCAAMIINPLLYKMNKAVIKKDWTTFNSLVVRIVTYVILIGAGTIIIAFLIGIPVLNLIFNVSLDEYLWSLIFIIIGSIATAIVAVLSGSLIAVRKNTIQMIIYLIVSLFATYITYLLTTNYGLYGACISFMGSMIMLMLIYIITYKLIIQKLKVSI